ncbi:MAG: hypothetical protein KC482_14595, partial [Dehalococcoidia bacterium]|nr:hypothetical protein [Dehalococcoidia bacterium]
QSLGRGLERLAGGGPGAGIQGDAPRRPGQPEPERELQPSDFGLPVHDVSTILGGDAAANVAMMNRLFSGDRGPIHDFVAMSASAALVAAGMADDFKQGAEAAGETMASGKPAVVLERYIELTQAAGS